MTFPTSIYPYGFQRALFWFYDVNGYATGISQSLSAGSASGAYVTSDVKAGNPAYAPVAELQIEGGDRIKATPSFGNPRMAAFDMTISAIDAVLIDLISQAARNAANSAFLKVGYNDNRASGVNMGVALQGLGEASDGTTRVVTRVIPKTSVLVRPGGFAFRGTSDATIRISPITGTKAPTGQVFASGATGLSFNWEEDKGSYYDIWSSNGLHIMTYNGDGSVATFTTTYKPLSSVITLNATANEFILNGTPTALTSFNTTTALATKAAAGTTGDKGVLVYETGFVAP